jgi:hypothetical protein
MRGAKERESIVKFDALGRLSSRLTVAACVALASVILASCGGGGATTQNEANGPLVLLPSAASIYAGVPYTFQIAGGRAPYLVSSSEPLLLPVPASVSGHSFQVVANNPGVVDTGSTATIPVRSVIITVRDSFGNTFATGAQNGITVVGNYLVGYGVSFVSNCSSGNACAGSDTLVGLRDTTNGGAYGNRAVRFCVVRGDFQFVIPQTPSNQPETLANCADTVTDHSGIAQARLRVPATAPSQIAVLRVFDVASGVYVDESFTIKAGAVNGNLTIIPNDSTFTGPRQGVCGTGSTDVLVFDGDPPYKATSSDANVSAFPSTSSENPGRFTITASNPNVCLDHVSVVITDAANRRATVTISTAEGSTTPPALAVSPTTITLNDTCGFASSVTAVGGTGSILANSTHPRVTAIVNANTVTVTRALHDPASPPGPAFYPATATISVTDGSTVSTVTVNGVATFCP